MNDDIPNPHKFGGQPPGTPAMEPIRKERYEWPTAEDFFKTVRDAIREDHFVEADPKPPEVKA